MLLCNFVLVDIFLHDVANLFLPALLNNSFAIGFLALPHTTQTAGSFSAFEFLRFN